MFLIADIRPSYVWLKFWVCYLIFVISSVWDGVQCTELQARGGTEERSYDLPQLAEDVGGLGKLSLFKSESLNLLNDEINPPRIDEDAESFNYGTPKKKRHLFLSATSKPLKCRESCDFEFQPSMPDVLENGQHVKKRCIASCTSESLKRAKLTGKEVEAIDRSIESRPFVNRDALTKIEHLKRHKREREGCCPMTCPPPVSCATCCTSCRPPCFTCPTPCPVCDTTKYQCMHICNTTTCPPCCIPHQTTQSKRRNRAASDSEADMPHRVTSRDIIVQNVMTFKSPHISCKCTTKKAECPICPTCCSTTTTTTVIPITSPCTCPQLLCVPNCPLKQDPSLQNDENAAGNRTRDKRSLAIDSAPYENIDREAAISVIPDKDHDLRNLNHPLMYKNNKLYRRNLAPLIDKVKKFKKCAVPSDFPKFTTPCPTTISCCPDCPGPKKLFTKAKKGTLFNRRNKQTKNSANIISKQRRCRFKFGSHSTVTPFQADGTSSDNKDKESKIYSAPVYNSCGSCVTCSTECTAFKPNTCCTKYPSSICTPVTCPNSSRALNMESHTKKTIFKRDDLLSYNNLLNQPSDDAALADSNQETKNENGMNERVKMQGLADKQAPRMTNQAPVLPPFKNLNSNLKCLCPMCYHSNQHAWALCNSQNIRSKPYNKDGSKPKRENLNEMDIGPGQHVEGCPAVTTAPRLFGATDDPNRLRKDVCGHLPSCPTCTMKTCPPELGNQISLMGTVPSVPLVNNRIKLEIGEKGDDKPISSERLCTPSQKMLPVCPPKAGSEVKTKSQGAAKRAAASLCTPPPACCGPCCTTEYVSCSTCPCSTINCCSCPPEKCCVPTKGACDKKKIASIVRTTKSNNAIDREAANAEILNDVGPFVHELLKNGLLPSQLLDKPETLIGLLGVNDDGENNERELNDVYLRPIRERPVPISK